MDQTKLVIIDTRVESYQLFIDSLQAGASHVLLDYESDTYSSLLTKINNLSLSSISSVALVSHSVIGTDYQMLSSAPLCRLPDVINVDSSLSSWSEWKQFWLDIGAPIIDLLGCAIYMDENWKYVLNRLESEMNVNFRASIDDTGALAVGGNWILESDNVNIKDVYFTQEIEGWSGLLISPSTICAIIDNNGKLYTAGSQTNGLAGHSSSSTSSRIRRFLLINSISNEVITQVSCSSHALCVTNTGKLYGWGLGGSRFGLSLSSYDTPMLLNNGALTGKFIVSCSAGNGFSLCLDSSGIIYSVGTTSTFIGRTTSNTAWNVITTITEKTVQISAGRLISACVTETGKMYTWGTNESGIGNGLSTGNTTLPFLAESSGVLQVSCGSCFIAYLKTDGKCYVMGNNSTFALSQFNSNIHVPSRLFKSDTTSSVVGNEYEWNTQISRVIAGNGIATIKQDGTVWTSGPNPSGYLGFGTSLTTNITGDPVKLPYRVKSYYNSGIGGSTGPSSNISLMHSVIIDSSDNLLVIGENTNSQLGVEDVLGNVTAVTSVTTVPLTFTRPTQNLNITKLMDDPLFYYPPKVTPSIDTSSVTHISYGQNITSSNISITMKDPNTNASVTGSFSYSPSLPITKPNVGTQNITWTFTPSDTTNYNTASGSVAITVIKVTPDVSGSVTSTSISYGQTLASSTLSGSFKNSNDDSLVSGSLVFNSPSSTPPIGTYSQSWTFIPTDTTNYNYKVSTINVTVTKADPSISLAISASSISYGEQLSQSTICGSFINSNDSSVVAGTLAFSSPSTKPSVSTTSASWTFTPSDTTNYNTASGSVAISVSKADPSYNNITTTAINAGQTLSTADISGFFFNPVDSVSITGSLSFNSPSNTPSETGSHNWTFTPTDLSNYNVQTGSVQVTVNSISKVTPAISTPISSQSISYGQTLADANIQGSFINNNTSETVTGTLAFNSPSDKPTVATSSAEWTFTPDNLNSYEIVTGTVDIAVARAIPSGGAYLDNYTIAYGVPISLLSINGAGDFTNPYDNEAVAGNLQFDDYQDGQSVGTGYLSWTFTPSDSDNYDPAVGSIEVAIVATEPSVDIIFNEPTSYGSSYSDIIQFVSATDPNSGYNVDGFFELLSVSPTDTVPSGYHEVSWLFSPDDQTNYLSATNTVTFTVPSNLIMPSPSGDVTASTLTFGQEYTESQLTYSFVDPATNDPVEGTVNIAWNETSMYPPVGINFYSYTFIPTNTATYDYYNGTLQLEVTKATPTANSLSVSSINSGDTLEDVVFTYQFINPNNQQSIPGTISFDSPSTVAVNGTSYSWTFTPSNTDNHNNATGSIEVTVISADETPSLSGSITSTNNIGNASVLASGGSMEQVSLSGLNAVFIPFGSKLRSTPISGSFVNQSSQSVNGVLRFTNPNYVPTLSDTSANWTFTPANRSLYNIVTGSVSIKVGYPVGTATVIPIITTIASNMDVSSSPTETVFVDKEVFGNSGLILAQALTNSVQLESLLSTTTTATAYVPVTVVGQTSSNSFSNVPYSVSLSNIPPNKPALYTLLPSPYFSSPIQNATTIAVMSYRIIDSSTNTFVPDLTATPITAEFNLGSSYANQALVVHHIDASNNVTSSTNVTADASGVIVYQITKNPNLVVTTQVINSSGNVAIYLPYIFDLSANGVVFGESVQGISADYFLEEDVSKSTLTVTLLKSALKYKDDLDLLYSNDLSSEELPVPSQQSINNIATKLNRIVDVSSLKFWQGSNSYTNSQTPFSTGSLGEQYIQYIASVLFGHPQAQAPIKNDEQILIDLCNCDLGAQFGGLQGLSDLGVRKFIFEQLVNNTKVTSNASGSRFDISDTDTTPSSGYVSYPFEEGDEIIIRIRMSGGLDADTATAFNPQLGTSSSPIDMVNIFGSTQGVTNSNNSLSITPKVWAIKFVIGA